MEPFSERLASFWNDLVTRQGRWFRCTYGATDATETVVLVSHGAAISALMNQVLVPGRYCLVPPTVVPSRFWNCSITEILVPVMHTLASPSSSTAPGDLSRQANWSIRHSPGRTRLAIPPRPPTPTEAAGYGQIGRSVGSKASSVGARARSVGQQDCQRVRERSSGQKAAGSGFHQGARW